MLTALSLLAPYTGAVTPHLERVRPHLCWLKLTEGPDAQWHFRLAGTLALGLLLFAVARFTWRWASSARVERRARQMLSAEDQDQVLVTGSEEPFCFSVGARRGLAVVSRGLVQQLDQQQLQALLAHEQAHIARRDNMWHLLLELAAIISLPLPTGFVYAHLWRSAAEADCDLQAAQATNSDMVSRLLELMHQRIGDMHRRRTAGLSPVYRAGLSPAHRAQRLVRAPRPTIAPPLKLVLVAEIALMMLVLVFARQWMWDSLYCAGKSVMDVMGGS